MNNITVITTSYNDSKNIVHYLDNMRIQTVQPLEYIVIDGGSKDNTIEITKEYAKKYCMNIRIIDGGRLNIAQGFNKGIKESNTEYILISCIGNSFPNDMIENLYNGITSNDYDSCYGRLVGINKGGFSDLYNNVFLHGEKGYYIMSNRCVLYNKRVFEKIGYFLENFYYAGEDAEFLQTFNNFGLKAKIIENTTVMWETPNTWKQYLKQQKVYQIAELQYAALKPQYFSKEMLHIYSMILSLVISLFLPWFLLYPIFIFAFQFLKSLRSWSYNIKHAFISYSKRYIRFYYRFRYYNFTKKRVIRQTK